MDKEILDKLFSNTDENGNTKPPITQNNLSEVSNYGSSVVRNFNRLADELHKDYSDIPNYQQFITNEAVGFDPDKSLEDLQKIKARNQSNWEKAAFSVGQLVGTEFVLGTLKGFSDIADAGINGLKSIYDNVTNNPNPTINDYTNPISEALEKAQDWTREKMKIELENPEQAWNPSDFGWWANNFVSVGSSLELMIPGKVVGGLGKLAKMTKAGKQVSKLISPIDGTLKAIHEGAQRINRSAAQGSKLAKGIQKAVAGEGKTIRFHNNYYSRAIGDRMEDLGYAMLSRTAENYQEARQTYKESYEYSLDKINNMSASQREVFFKNNPQFVGKSNDEIAKIISTQSANETFVNDYTMLLFDYMQFRSVGSILKRAKTNPVSNYTKLSAKQATAKMAGREVESEIVNTGIKGKYNVFKNWLAAAKQDKIGASKDVLRFIQYNEGIEEAYQGMQQEKGEEVARLMLDPTYNTRDLVSYLNDGEIWTQAFWGMLGGKVFEYGYNKFENYVHKNKIYSEEKMRDEVINGWKDKFDKYVSDIKLAEQGKNPYEFEMNEDGTNKLDAQNKPINIALGTDQDIETAKKKATERFVADLAMQAEDAGISDLLMDALNSEDIEQYFESQGMSNKELTAGLKEKMEEVRDMYDKSLYNWFTNGDIVDENILRAISRNEVRTRLQIENNNEEINDIYQALSNDENYSKEDLNDYITSINLAQVNRDLQTLRQEYARKEQAYNNKQISKSAFDAYKKSYAKHYNSIMDYARANTQLGIDEVTNIFEEAQKNPIKEFTLDNINDFYQQFERAYTDYFDTEKTIKKPTVNIQEKVKRIAQLELDNIYQESTLPNTEQDYVDAGVENKYKFDKYYKDKLDGYVKSIKEYLENADNVDVAFNNLLSGENLSSTLQNATEALKYGHESYKYFTDTIKDFYNLVKKQKAQEQQDANSGVSGGETFNNNDGTNPQVIDEAPTDNDNSPVEGETTLAPDIDDAIGVTSAANEEDRTTPLPTGKLVETTPTTPTPQSNDEEGTAAISQDILDSVFAETAVSPAELEAARVAQELDSHAALYNIDKQSMDIVNHVRQLKLQISSELSKLLHENPQERAKFISDKVVEYKDKWDNVKEITEKEKAKYDFFNENRKLLTDAGVENNSANAILENIYRDVIAQISNKYKGFEKLLKDAIAGYGYEGLDSSAKFLDNAETIDNFIEAYCEKYNVPIRKDKVTIIDLQKLFDAILNDKENPVNGEDFFNLYNNLGIYAANSDKYIFTGVNLNKQYGFHTILNKLKFKNEQVTISNNYMHVGLPNKIDQEKYNATVGALYNQKKKAKIRFVKPGVYEIHSDIIGEDVVLGILRPVNGNSTFTTFEPVHNYSGFMNRVSKNDNGTYTLEIDDIIYDLIEHDDNNVDATDLYNILYDYTIALFQKENVDFVTDEIATAILNNKYIKNLLNDKGFAFPNKGEDMTDADKAAFILNHMSSILFFGQTLETNLANIDISEMSIDPSDLRSKYDQWKKRVFENYRDTYNIQKAYESNPDMDFDVIGNIVETRIVDVQDGTEVARNVSELEFNTNPNSVKDGKMYNPLVVIRDGEMFGETINEQQGISYGRAADNIPNGSMGYLITGKDGRKYVALLNTQNNVSNTELGRAVASEIRSLLGAHFINRNKPNTNRFDTIAERLEELFSKDGLFSFWGETEDGVRYWYEFGKTNDGKRIFINKKFADNRNSEGVFTMFKYNRNNTISSAIKVYEKDVYLSKGTQEEFAILDEMIDDMTSNIHIRTSNAAFNKLRSNGKHLHYQDITAEGFVLKFGYNDNARTFAYKSFGDMVSQLDAYTVKQSYTEDANGRKQYTQLSVGEPGIYLNVNDSYNINDSSRSISANSPLNLMYERQLNRKTIAANDLLLSSGFPQSYLDSIKKLSDIIGKPLIVQNVYSASKEQLEKHPTADAFYSEGKVYITPIGAMRMINNPINAFRILLHENIHRIFEQDKTLNKKRLVEDLKEIFDYTMEQLDPVADKDIIAVLKTATDNATIEENMEEFLVETLTQRRLMDRLNNIAWKDNVDVTNAENKNKSIFNKIIDWLLKFFGINNGNIKKNSIFAKEYEILLKNINKQERQVVNIGELSAASETMNNIAEDFSKSIKRDENFEENHTYHIWNGKEFVVADTSVTTLIHGGEKQDFGKWGPVSTRLGNTADEIARDYFAGELKVEYPNMTQNGLESLVKRLDNLKKHFDKIYGAGKYKCFTNEFPIGAKYIDGEGNVKYVAGTMDMVIVDDKGNVHIYDFKTKRRSENNPNAVIDDNAKESYGKQVNLYKEILEINYPDLKGKIVDLHLIKFTTDYTDPNDLDYITSPVKGNNQLYVEENGEQVPIQDSTNSDYFEPTLEKNLTDEVIISRPINNTGFTLQALDKYEEKEDTNRDNNDNINADQADTAVDEEDDFNLDNTVLEDFGLENNEEDDELDDYLDDESTAQNLDDFESKTTDEVVIDSMFNSDAHNPFGGVKISDLSNLADMVNSDEIANFSSQIDENEVLYACKVI